MKVLIVDDSKTDVMMISGMLRDYELRVACDGIEALETMGREKDIDIIILDLNMPRMNGFEVLEAIKDDPAGSSMVTLILTNYDETDNEIRGLELGAVDYIRKPLNIRSLRKRLELHVSLKNAQKALEQHNQALEKAVRDRTEECNRTRDLTIHALLGLLEIRNIESCNHTRRTQWIMKALCEHMRFKGPYQTILTPAYTNELFDTSPLHDIGKVGIPDSILLKPGKLTAEEFEIMKRHTTYGVEALSCEGFESVDLSFIKTASELMGTHHEKYDGSGYPNGLKGKDIPLSGRLMAIIDVYDALVSVRVYKPAYSHAQALQIIAEGRGSHFDPDIVDAFFDIEDKVKDITAQFS
jgi:putative two-component system response regulator